jgi:hypothetical protein
MSSKKSIYGVHPGLLRIQKSNADFDPDLYLEEAERDVENMFSHR